MLHIHNGDCSADTARKSALAGEHLAWRESLITGPTPAGLSDSEWRSVRAQHLSEAYGVEVQECERGLLRQEEALASFSEHDEVVLWFEHDLFCQLHLIYLLDWFSQRDRGKTMLSLICIGEFPGKENFRGLGELNPAELASLFPGRQPVSAQQMKIATSAWETYSSANPTEIGNLLEGDTSALPFLRAALQAHLRRFPSTKNGLGRIENRAVDLIHGGLIRFLDLFPKFCETEAVYGLGDAQLWLAVQRLIATGQPLLTIKSAACEYDRRVLTPDVVKEATFEVTGLGESVLKGEADFVMVNGIDLWLGGAYLHDGEGFWRWDEQTRALVSDSGQ